MEDDHYMILGVDQKATVGKIRQAFKQMARTYHPDKNRHPRTEEHFKKIKRAYDVLSDASLRRAYDRTLQRRSVKTVNTPRPRSVKTFSTPSPGITHPKSQQTNQVQLRPWVPISCAVGVALVGLLAGFGAFKMSNSSRGNN
ncbi:hypothetical protein KR084_010251 [Drosophila pseudotakahashii]|nr:hypothetical protein KR084_010251 [Drosophila pseudotakahashii]